MCCPLFRVKSSITLSYSRPRCSNDNAFIESWHKTLKYTPGYPGYFTSLEHARMWYADFVHWYNHEHQHSALGYVTPHQRRTGEATAIYAKRNKTMLMAQQKNPSRWRTGKIHLYDASNPIMIARPIRKAS
ncbi:MAG: integrase core domain-containing protein [Treponema sp.]|nr:integrase core domain-containing protein [Treponema sp.]